MRLNLGAILCYGSSNSKSFDRHHYAAPPSKKKNYSYVPPISQYLTLLHRHFPNASFSIRSDFKIHLASDVLTITEFKKNTSLFCATPYLSVHSVTNEHTPPSFWWHRTYQSRPRYRLPYSFLFFLSLSISAIAIFHIRQRPLPFLPSRIYCLLNTLSFNAVQSGVLSALQNKSKINNNVIRNSVIIEYDAMSIDSHRRLAEGSCLHLQLNILEYPWSWRYRMLVALCWSTWYSNILHKKLFEQYSCNNVSSHSNEAICWQL